MLSPITLPEGESPDAAAMRELIQSSIADGHSREAVATYLRDHMGLLQPDALIDASLGINQP